MTDDTAASERTIRNRITEGPPVNDPPDDMDDDDDDGPFPPLEQVQLTPAYLFDCPECGTENFQRTVSRYFDPSQEDHAQIIERELGPDELAEALDLQTRVPSFRMVCSTNPRSVVCKECFAQFAVIPPDRDEPFDEEDEDSELDDDGE